MTWMSRIRGIGLLTAALVFSVASGSKGDRAESGACPEGEVCSPDTPSGLRFQGPGFADALLDFDLHTTAVGGQQTVHVEPAGLFEHLNNFDAETLEEHTEVVSVNPPRVTLTGSSEGSTYLRIFEPNTGALYDRITVSARDVDSVELEPLVYESAFDDDALHPPLYWGGDSMVWIGRIYGGSARLVDENLAFGGAGTVGAIATQSGVWDLATVIPTSADAVITVSAMTGSGVIGEGDAEMAYVVDTILENLDSPVPETHDASDQLSVCFAAYLGERRILGIPWEFTMTGPSGEEPDHLSTVLFATNCVQLRASVEGVWQLDVTAGDITESYDIIMEPPQPAPPPPAPLPSATPDDSAPPQARAFRGTLGVRARRQLLQPTSVQ